MERNIRRTSRFSLWISTTLNFAFVFVLREFLFGILLINKFYYLRGLGWIRHLMVVYFIVRFVTTSLVLTQSHISVHSADASDSAVIWHCSQQELIYIRISLLSDSDINRPEWWRHKSNDTAPLYDLGCSITEIILTS